MVRFEPEVSPHQEEHNSLWVCILCLIFLFLISIFQLIQNVLYLVDAHISLFTFLLDTVL